MFRCVRAGLVLGSLLAAVPAGLRALEAMQWKPPVERPRLRFASRNETYDRVFNEAYEKVDLEALEASTLPARYNKIIRFMSGSPAPELGLHVADRILDQDGVFYWEQYPDVEADLHILAADGSRKTVRRSAAPLRVEIVDKWHVELEYVRNGPRDAKWERHMLVATTAYTSNPKLAETALAAALFHGYPRNRFADQLACAICFYGHDYERALDFGHFALEGCPENEMHPTGSFFVASALVTYQYSAAVQMLERVHRSCWVNRERLEKLIKDYEKMPPEKRPPVKPTTAADSMQVISLKGRWEPFGNNATVKLQEYATYGRFVYSASIEDSGWSHYTTCFWGPAIKSGALRIQFAGRQTRDVAAIQWTDFMFGFIRPDQVELKGDKAVVKDKGYNFGFNLRIRITQRGDRDHIVVYHPSKAFVVRLPWPDHGLDYRRINEAVVVFAEDSYQTVFNRQQVFFGPRGEGLDELIPYISLVGSTIAVSKLEYFELVGNEEEEPLF